MSDFDPYVVTSETEPERPDNIPDDVQHQWVKRGDKWELLLLDDKGWVKPKEFFQTSGDDVDRVARAILDMEGQGNKEPDEATRSRAQYIAEEISLAQGDISSMSDEELGHLVEFGEDYLSSMAEPGAVGRTGDLADMMNVYNGAQVLSQTRVPFDDQISQKIVIDKWLNDGGKLERHIVENFGEEYWTSLSPSQKREIKAKATELMTRSNKPGTTANWEDSVRLAYNKVLGSANAESGANRWSQEEIDSFAEKPSGLTSAENGVWAPVEYILAEERKILNDPDANHDILRYDGSIDGGLSGGKDTPWAERQGYMAEITPLSERNLGYAGETPTYVAEGWARWSDLERAMGGFGGLESVIQRQLSGFETAAGEPSVGQAPLGYWSDGKWVSVTDEEGMPVTDKAVSLDTLMIDRELPAMLQLGSRHEQFREALGFGELDRSGPLTNLGKEKVTLATILQRLHSMSDDELIPIQHMLKSTGYYGGAIPNFGMFDTETFNALSDFLMDFESEGLDMSADEWILSKQREYDLNIKLSMQDQLSQAGITELYGIRKTDMESVKGAMTLMGEELLGYTPPEELVNQLANTWSGIEESNQRNTAEFAMWEQAYGEGGPPGIDEFMMALSGQESGGSADPYTLRNPDSGAYGKFQIMPANWGPWSADAGIPGASPSDPQAQEIVTRHRLSQLYQQYGGDWRLVAIAWYAGEGTVQGMLEGRISGNASEGAYPTINEYATQVMGRFQGWLGTGAPGGGAQPEVYYESYSDPNVIAEMQFKESDAYKSAQLRNRAYEFFSMLGPGGGTGLGRMSANV